MLVVLAWVVFALTNVNKAPKIKGSLNYEQLVQKVKTSPQEIEEVCLINNEPMAYVKLKSDSFKKQMLLSPEQKANLMKDAKEAGVMLKTQPLQEESSFWWEFRMPGFSVGEP